MRFALINNGIVENVVKCSEQNCYMYEDDYELVINVTNTRVGPNWTYDGYTFSPPEEAE